MDFDGRRTLDLIRGFNDSLPEHFVGRKDLLSLLEPPAYVIAQQIYKEGRHWHSVSGKCHKEVPFEVYMQGLGFLISCWVTDIFLRKARDRRTPAMARRHADWLKEMLSTMEYIGDDVMCFRDYEAERAFKGDYKKPNRFLCLIHKLIWGH